MIAATIPKRSDKKVKGSTKGNPTFTTMKPVDHKTTNTAGAKAVQANDDGA